MNSQSKNELLKELLLICFLVLSVNIGFAQTFTISGKVKSSESGESLQGVNIFLESTQNGTISNEYGFYSLKTNSSSSVILTSHLGYKQNKIKFFIVSDTTINIELTPALFEINEVVISGIYKSNVKRSQMSLSNLSIQTIKRMPQILGEADIIKSLQYLPGVNSTNEGTNSISVRGGSFGQNLIMLDEAVLLNPNHAFAIHRII